MRMVGFEHELHELHESFWHTDEHGFTVRMVGFEHESHELHESFWHTDGHGFTVRRITLFILPQIAQMDTDLEF